MDNREAFMRERMGQFAEINRQNWEAWRNGVQVSIDGVATQADLDRHRCENIEAMRAAFQPLRTGNQQMVAAQRTCPN